MELGRRGDEVKNIILLSLLAFFLFLFSGCTEVKTYMAQREQDKALENLKKGFLEGQRYKNQLYECEIIGPPNWKAQLAYPEALVIYTKEDKLTRFKLEIRELEGDKEKKGIGDFISEKEKTPTYKKIKEQRARLGRYQALEVDFEGRWREEAKGDPITEKILYFETKKYVFILSCYTLEALWNRNEGFFNESIKSFIFTGEKAGGVLHAPAAVSTTPKPKTQPSPAVPPKSSSCTPKYLGKVTSTDDDLITFNLGSQQCITKGMTGKIYYEKIFAGNPKKIYIARIKVTSTSPQTANASVIESTDEPVKLDFWVEIDEK